MALEGTIKDFGLPDIFQLIGLQRKTGILTLRHETDNVTVSFENGMVVMADSSTKRLEDRLGSVLVKQGKLAKDKLDDALQTQKATLQRLGHVLTNSNFITEKDLKDALQIQVSQLVFKVFRWRDGDYHFEPTATVEYDGQFFSPMSADFILMEGMRMVDEWPIIEKKIPSMDIVFRPVVDPALIVIGQPEDGRGATLEGKHVAAVSPSNKIRLTAAEENIFRKVDGTRTVQGIIDVTGVSEFEACRTLFDLLNRNLISNVGRGMAREMDIGLAPPQETPRTGIVVIVVISLVALLGALWHYDTPFAVVGQGPFLRTAVRRVLEGARQGRLERLDRGIVAYRLMQGSLPRATGDVVARGLVDLRDLQDPWARPFHYAQTEQGYVLYAVDATGRAVAGTVIDRFVSPENP